MANRVAYLTNEAERMAGKIDLMQNKLKQRELILEKKEKEQEQLR